jgi:uncharacterized protein
MHRRRTFSLCVAIGTPQQIQAAITNGVDVNAADLQYGITPVMSAANNNTNPEVIALLIRAGANVNAADNEGSTPLMKAAAYNPNPAVITALLKGGADAKAKNKLGQTALDYAQYNDSLKGTDAIMKLEQATK